uniref:Uncharacterized protein n=1 Tax=Rhodopseudomonas palustris (strain DX-1) TaxID=652103 RepID=E6VL59_RHOPX
MIREAAKAASRAFDAHWLKSVMEKRERRISTTEARHVRRMQFAEQASDIETVLGTVR